MISETTGAWMIVAGVVLGVVSWIGLRVSLRRERAQRLWRAWRMSRRAWGAPGGVPGYRGDIWMGDGRRVTR
jgi:hypothetical protein